MGFFLPLYALPLYKVKAIILNHMFFRTFNLNCQGRYKNDTLWQARTEVSNLTFLVDVQFLKSLEKG